MNCFMLKPDKKTEIVMIHLLALICDIVGAVSVEILLDTNVLEGASSPLHSNVIE